MINGTRNDKSTEQANQWANLLADLFDRLTGKGAEVPQGSQLGSAKWVINGRLAITAQSSKVS